MFTRAGAATANARPLSSSPRTSRSSFRSHSAVSAVSNGARQHRARVGDDEVDGAEVAADASAAARSASASETSAGSASTRAGVSVDDDVRLEQDRNTHPSAQVLDAPARALHLDDDGVAHLASCR